MAAPQETDIAVEDVKYDTFDSYLVDDARGVQWEITLTEEGGTLNLDFLGGSVFNVELGDWIETATFLASFHFVYKGYAPADAPGLAVYDAWVDAIRAESARRDLEAISRVQASPIEQAIAKMAKAVFA